MHISPNLTLTAELERARSSYLDVMLPDGREDWPSYDSGLTSYENTFSGVLDGQSIPGLLRDRAEPLAIDLMASSTALFDISSSGIVGRGFRGISVSLGDNRCEFEVQLNHERGIDHVTGDLSYPSTWNTLTRAMDNRRADLVMSRALWGLNTIPNHPVYYRQTMSRLWNILKPDGGIMLIQILPSHAEAGTTEWVRELRNQGINARLAQDATTKNYWVLRIDRKHKSPDHLPAYSGSNEPGMYLGDVSSALPEFVPSAAIYAFLQRQAPRQL